MPSKKRKYNARFPAGRIKKIMQTDEEVGKVAQAVPIIISRTLELFVESLLRKALQVTNSRNAKTLSPSHVKQCILAEARFDFLRDLVKNIPDVSVAEEKELLSEENSPNSSRFSDITTQPPRLAREDSNSSSSCDVRTQHITAISREHLKRGASLETERSSKEIPGTSVMDLSKEPFVTIEPVEPRKEPITPLEPATSDGSLVIDLSKKEDKPIRTANFYHDTLMTDEPQKSVITLNPSYTSPQPSTSYTTSNPIEPVRKIDVPKQALQRHNSLPRTPVTPILNIDFSKNMENPVIKVLDTPAAVLPRNDTKRHASRQNSKSKIDVKQKVEMKPVIRAVPVDIDRLNSGNLQIDEDYDT